MFTPDNLRKLAKDGYNIQKFQIKSELKKGLQEFLWDTFPLNELKELVLENCWVFRMEYAAYYLSRNLSNLTSLSLLNSDVHPDFQTIFKHLKNLQRLRFVDGDLSNGDLSDIFSALGHNVKELEIGAESKKRVFWNEIPSNYLEKFTLINCWVEKSDNHSNYSMQQFPHLKSLSLLHTKMESAFLIKLHELRNLESVRFIGKEVWAPILVKVFSKFGMNIKQLDLSQMDIGIFYGGTELSDVLSLTPNLEELTLNGCAHLPHDVLLELSRHHSDICPNLRRIAAKGTCLTQTSLPDAWRVNGVGIIVDC